MYVFYVSKGQSVTLQTIILNCISIWVLTTVSSMGLFILQSLRQKVCGI